MTQTLSCRKWSGRGGHQRPEGPARVVGDPVPLGLHDDLALPDGAHQVRAEVRPGMNIIRLCIQEWSHVTQSAEKIWIGGNLQDLMLRDIDICELQLFWQRVDLIA